MLTFKMIIVFFGLIGMVTALVLDKMRPGMIRSLLLYSFFVSVY